MYIHGISRRKWSSDVYEVLVLVGRTDFLSVFHVRRSPLDDIVARYVPSAFGDSRARI